LSAAEFKKQIMQDVLMLGIAALFTISSWLLIILSDTLLGGSDERK
jgi:hypothetical protein